MTGASSPSSFQMARRKFVDACAAFAQQATDIEAGYWKTGSVPRRQHDALTSKE